MGSFEIDINRARQSAQKLISVERDLKRNRSCVKRVASNLKSHDFYYADSSLKITEKNIRVVYNRIKKLSTSLEEIVKMYEATEKNIAGEKIDQETARSDSPSGSSSSGGVNFDDTDAVWDYIIHNWQNPAALIAFLREYFNYLNTPKPHKVDSVVFDSDGSYGGNQGNMENHYFENWREYLDYLHEYFPDMTKEQGYAYLQRLNSVGCGYVAIVNTLFMAYEGREAQFEKDFGYPMYKDGDLNFDRLLLDVYATTDIADINDRKDGLPKGTRQESRDQILQNFLQEKNASVKASSEFDANVTPQNFKSISENGGKVVISLHDDNIYNKDGKHHIKGGHAMTVTGVTDDGKFIVSSWGDIFYIDSAELDSNDSFSVISYEF